MAGWTTTAWENVDWSEVAVLQDWYDAVEERRTSFSVEPDHCWGARPPLGDDVHGASFWAALQNWIEENCIYFVRSHEYDGTLRTNGTDFLDGLTTGIDKHIWDFERLMLSVSQEVAAAGDRKFRRVPGPDLPANWTDWNDPAYSYGPMQAADIIGAWIFYDIQEALNRMIWTWAGHFNTLYDAKDGEWAVEEGEGENTRKNWSGTQESTKAAAIATVTADADDLVAWGPVKWNVLTHPGTEYKVTSCVAIKDEYEIQDNAFTLDADPEATFYVAFSDERLDEWDDHDTGYPKDEWIKFATKVAVDALPKKSVELYGDYDGTFTTDVAAYVAGDAGDKGFEVKNVANNQGDDVYDWCGAILDWNREDGYTYRP